MSTLKKPLNGAFLYEIYEGICGIRQSRKEFIGTELLQL
jgi:hypothetical protein